LRNIVAQNGLDDHVHFREKIPRQQMPVLLSEFDVLLFPSIWEEPFARIVLEAMAAGLVVIGTTTGGTKEILVDNVNGRTFAPEDSAALARHIQEVYNDSVLRTQIVSVARQTVVQRFSIASMVDHIEQYLVEVAQETTNKIPVS
jgi:glycosyltransferase involved in cell wall biosynthesis